MADCVSTQELPESSANDASVDKVMEADEDSCLNPCVVKQLEDITSVHDSITVTHSKCDNMPQMGEEEQEFAVIKEDHEGPQSMDDRSIDGAQAADATNPNSPESGEVSEKEYFSDTALRNKHLHSVQSGDLDEPQNQDEFFNDDRSETPLQDEQEAEKSQYMNADDASSEYVSPGVQLCDRVVPSPQQEQNTDGELSDDDDKTSQGLVEDDAENVSDIEKSLSKTMEENAERKASVADDYGELDYEEEEAAEDNLDKVKSGEERKKKEKITNKDVSGRNDSQSQVSQEEEDGEEHEDGEEIVKAKDCKAEKKAVLEEQEEGEEPEEGEHSTDGELDDDDDCEEGEIREPGQKHAFVRPMCRFYTRGNCTWGNNCRFLHPGINDKGNYSMIDQSFPPGPSGIMGPMIMGPSIRAPLPPPPGPHGSWIHERLGKRVIPRRPPEIDTDVPLTSAPLPPPPTVAETATESAWERGLRHAKEIRKMAKRKETDPAFEEKKDSDAEETREPVPAAAAPPPPISGPLPPPRDPYYDDLPANRFEDESFYGRPPLPLPPPDVWTFRPPHIDPFEMRWPRGPLEFPPLPPPDFRLPERERALRERRFSPPPRFEPGRPPEDRFGRLNRFEHRYYRDGPVREPLPAPPTDIPVRGRGEEWKDPWLRSRSPKRKRASSSRSGSRGRRRSRSHSKGSYSSFSSSSYSSKSRSRSRSSSYSSSYSKSSRSHSSYSSRSSSGSRSRSSSPRKSLPVATTLGQSILEKHGKAGDGPRSVINKVPASAIGSVPLPPNDKTSTPLASQTVKMIPPPVPAAAATVLPPAVSNISRPSAAMQPEAVQLPSPASQPSTKLMPPGGPMPIGAKPIVVPGRPATLQPVGPGVAAAFSDKDEEQLDIPRSSRSQLPPPSPVTPDKASSAQTIDRSKVQQPSSAEKNVEKGSVVAASERGGSSRNQQPVPEMNRSRSKELGQGSVPKSTSAPRQAPSEKPTGRTNQPPVGKDLMKNSQPGLSGDRAVTRSQVSDGERSSSRLPMGSEKASAKGLVSDRDRSSSVRGSSQMALQPGGKTVSRHGGGRAVAAPADRTKVDPAIKRRERMKSSSTESSRLRSRSTSGSMSRSSSSASRDSEHLYSDIASPISSASSMSPVPSPALKLRQVEKGRVPVTKNSSGRLPPPQMAPSLSQQRSDSYRAEPRDRVPSSASRPVQSFSSHMPSSRSGGAREISREGGGREAGGREVGGRETGGRSNSSSGVSHAREMGMADSRLRTSGSMSSAHASQSNQPSSRNPDPHLSQKGNIKLTLKNDRPSGQLPPPPAVSGRKRPASPLGRLSPPGKLIRRGPEQKEPVKIPIPRHEKIRKPSSSPQRRRSDSGHFQVTSPLSKVPPSSSSSKPTPTKPPASGAHATSSSSSSASKRKGAMSRREELLMQLQAVEDAIAKKRSKMQ